MKADIDPKDLTNVLGRVLETEILSADHKSKQLQGGTLGNVVLVEGKAVTGKGEIPYSIVFKSQKKWRRPGDDESWRREYDLYMSDFEESFSDNFRWPRCYSADIDGDRINIWMEYIKGACGLDLTAGMLEKTALEIGRYQGRTIKEPGFLKDIKCLGDTGVLRREYMQWHNQTYSYEFLVSEKCRLPDFLKALYREGKIEYNDRTMEYNYLRSSECGIPGHLKQMLYDIDENMDDIFHKIGQLPVVLCHRDLWIENIFYSDGEICLIDWDSAGWGHMGEDIAALIADETEPELLGEYYGRFIPAYVKGLSEYIDVSSIKDLYIWEMIIIKFGYRIVQEYMFNKSPDVKKDQILMLQRIFELKEGSR